MRTSNWKSAGKIVNVIRLILIVLVVVSPIAAQNDTVMKAMRDEMARSKTDLHLADLEKPYFIEYRVDDNSTTTIGATLGVLTSSNTSRSRVLTLHVRVGNYAFDNTNFLAVQSFASRMGFMPTVESLPLDDDYDEIRRTLWLATDAAYKQAASGLAAKRSVLQTRKYSSTLPDFTAQKPVSITEPPIETKFDQGTLEKLARDISAVFRNSPDIIDSNVTIVVRNLYVRYLNSEGTTYTRSEPIVAVRVNADARATDEFPLHDSFRAFSRGADEIRPEALIEQTKQLALRLARQRESASLDRYNGPVLFEGEAAGGVLSDVFAPAISASRFPVTDEPQFEASFTQMFGQIGGATLVDKLGGRVMPDFLDVSDKPSLEAYEGTKLLGTRKIDDEGVPTQDLKIVEAGILKTVLATRTPTEETKVSTGNKGVFGAVPSNLFLNAAQSETNSQLRGHLLRLAKARGYDYGIVVRHATDGGLSWLAKLSGSMGGPNFGGDFNIEMYKVFDDGHEELLRGVEVGALTAASFKDIVAVGDKPVVYHGPHVPIMTSILAGFGQGNLSGDFLAVGSFVAPSILFEEISLKKAKVPAPNPPVVPSPLPAFVAK